MAEKRPGDRVAVRRLDNAKERALWSGKAGAVTEVRPPESYCRFRIAVLLDGWEHAVWFAPVELEVEPVAVEDV